MITFSVFCTLCQSTLIILFIFTKDLNNFSLYCTTNCVKSLAVCSVHWMAFCKKLSLCRETPVQGCSKNGYYGQLRQTFRTVSMREFYVSKLSVCRSTNIYFLEHLLDNIWVSAFHSFITAISMFFSFVSKNKS